MIDIDVIRTFLSYFGDANGVWDFRALHDTDKGRDGIPLRGTLSEVSQSLDWYNSQGYGIFLTINELDGNGRKRENVVKIRAHFTDSDADHDWSVYHAMRAWEIPPTFSVITSPGKHHEYWIVDPYSAYGDGIGKFETIQQKLIALWKSDPPVWDGPRVMRVPGTANMKNPASPTMAGISPGSGQRVALAALEWALMNVDASSANAERHELGEKSAPSLEWANYALSKIDPGSLDRLEWLKVSAAYKASAFAFGEVEARRAWDEWCAQYPDNDLAENEKLWSSVRDTKTGWGYLETASGVKLERMFGKTPASAPAPSSADPALPVPTPTATQPSVVPNGSAFLLPNEQAAYFKGCFLIGSMGKILIPSGRFYDSTKFNAQYGGKVFVLDANGAKTTDEPWKAATRGQVFQIPKVDGIRFLPYREPGAIITDELGREAVNTYKPAIVHSEPGDITPFLTHMHKMIPNDRDRSIIFNYLRHQVQRPGRKVFWTVLIQSSEGAGKGILKYLMTYALGGIYVHAPNAKELTEGGGKFNAWMRSKLLIVADEIRVDDKRDMIEVLKPMITEARIEIQGKGLDQETEDNVANWIMFTNYKDAIPITANDRRYSIFYSAIQSVDDLARLGMTGTYFPLLYAWLYDKGAAYVTHWLKNTPIDAEFDPLGAAHRAPETSSTAEALIQSHGKVEAMITEAIEEGRPGFRGGFLSSVMVAKLLKEENIRVGPQALGRAFEALGFRKLGRAQSFFQEDMKQPYVWSRNPGANITDYAAAQNYGFQNIPKPSA